MATVSQSRFGAIEHSHPLWTQTFSDKERTQLLEEDLSAGKHVALILMTIVFLGLCGAVLTVLATL